VLEDTIPGLESNMVSVTYPRIDRAMGIVEDEIDILAAESDEFQAFLRQLETISTDSFETAASDSGTAVGTMADASRPTSNLQTVRTAYRETVMAVPHYESEYGEPLEAHLASEIDVSLACQITRGTVLTGPVLAALRGAIGETLTKRADLLTELQRERESLESVVGRLTELERRTHEIGVQLEDEAHDSVAATLETLEERCTELARDRQRTIHGRSANAWSGIDEESLLQYLYVDLETNTPALAAIGSCLETVRRHQRHL